MAGDGWETAGEGQAAGGIKFGSIEVAEARFPLTFEHHEFRADSGGDGTHRGGVGAELRLRVDDREPAVANTAGDGVRHAPYGLLGGARWPPPPVPYPPAGRPDANAQHARRSGSSSAPATCFSSESSGGGGYGPAPRGARPEARRQDAVNGLVSRSTRRTGSVADDLLNRSARGPTRICSGATWGSRSTRPEKADSAACADPRRSCATAPARRARRGPRDRGRRGGGRALGTYGSAAAGGVDQATLDLNVTYIAAARGRRSSPRARSSVAAAPSRSARPA